MSNEYGAGPPLSYNRYLRVRDLIELQGCLSDPPHHDELLFITIHQTYELWFKQILHEIDAAVAAMREDRAPLATRALVRIAEIERVLVNQIHVLETMSPINFLGFRDKLNPASGFQSMQFREIEFSSGLRNERILGAFSDDEFATPRLRARYDGPTLAAEFFRLLSRRGLDAPSDDPSLAEDERLDLYDRRTRAVLEVLTHFEERYEEYQLGEALIAHDEYFSLWRHHHVKMVERMLGTKRGTGGSEGVGYLRTTLDKKFFPELWEARAHLDSGHGAQGCPFAGRT
jgi:tryptophan 2,3-dioxygenase